MSNNGRNEFIQGLRDLADFLESNPEMQYPTYNNLYVFYDKIADAPKVAAMMSPCEKHYTDNFFSLKKRFGKHLTFEANWSRDVVCKRVQVGTKTVPEYVIPAHEEPVYEWDCGEKSLLGSNNQANQLSQGDD